MPRVFAPFFGVGKDSFPTREIDLFSLGGFLPILPQQLLSSSSPFSPRTGVVNYREYVFDAFSTRAPRKNLIWHIRFGASIKSSTLRPLFVPRGDKNETIPPAFDILSCLGRNLLSRAGRLARNKIHPGLRKAPPFRGGIVSG